MNIQYPTRNIQSRRKEIKPEAVDFRVSDLSGVVRRLPDEDGCYRVANSVSAGLSGVASAKTEAGFSSRGGSAFGMIEPNSPH